VFLEGVAIAAVAAPGVLRRPEDQLALLFGEIGAAADCGQDRGERRDPRYL
jgi:hypothetical protein